MQSSFNKSTLPAEEQQVTQKSSVLLQTEVWGCSLLYFTVPEEDTICCSWKYVL